MKWTFEQKLSWAKADMDGELVPVPEGFSRSIRRWHDRVREWVRVLLKYGEERLNPSRQKRYLPPEAKLAAINRALAGSTAPHWTISWTVSKPIETLDSQTFSISSALSKTSARASPGLWKHTPHSVKNPSSNRLRISSSFICLTSTIRRGNNQLMLLPMTG